MSATALVRVDAIFTFPDPLEQRRASIEERVPLAELLCAHTVEDAMKCFLANTDVVTAADHVTSIMVDGFEIVETFRQKDNIEEMLRKRRQMEEMTRLLRRSTDALDEARAQREMGGHIEDDIFRMLEKTIAVVGDSLKDGADQLGLTWQPLR